MLRKLVMGLGVVLGTLTLASCDKDDDNDDDDNIETFSATLSGANEVPAVTTTATGTVTGSYNKTTKILTLTITYSGLSSAATMWHVHKGAAGESGPPVDGLTFPALGASPFVWTSTALTASMETDLMNDLYYVNIHTTNHVNGEIRGQLRD